MLSLVVSISLYACESWSLTAELEKMTQAFKMRRHRKSLNVSCKHYVNNEDSHRKIQTAFGKYDELQPLVEKRKLR